MVRRNPMSAKNTTTQDINLPNICTMTMDKYFLYLGSYEFNEEKTTGKIYKFCKNSLIKEYEVATTGTFHILKYNKLIISFNKTNLLILDEELNVINNIKTDYMNIFGEVYKQTDVPKLPHDILIVTTDKGYIVIYDLIELCLGKNIHINVFITDGIIWSVFKYKKYLLFGTDNCQVLVFDFLQFVDFTNKLVQPLQSIKTETAPTFFNLINNDLYVLTYKYLYKFNLNDHFCMDKEELRVKDKAKLDGKNHILIEIEKGGWRFYELKNTLSNYFVILNDTGCYLFNKYSFNLVNHFATNSNCYALVQIENKLCFSAFYCNKIYLELI